MAKEVEIFVAYGTCGKLMKVMYNLCGKSERRHWNGVGDQCYVDDTGSVYVGVLGSKIVNWTSQQTGIKNTAFFKSYYVFYTDLFRYLNHSQCFHTLITSHCGGAVG